MEERVLGSNDFVDKELECCDCGAIFTFTVGEQWYYYGRGLSETKRCPSCRAMRKATRAPGLGRGRNGY